MTLYDLLSHISFDFSKANIEDSWAFDGTDPALPYVFAPVRYRDPFGGIDSAGNAIDNNVEITYMRPALSKYWIIFKKRS